VPLVGTVKPLAVMLLLAANVVKLPVDAVVAPMAVEFRPVEVISAL